MCTEGYSPSTCHGLHTKVDMAVGAIRELLQLVSTGEREHNFGSDVHAIYGTKRSAVLVPCTLPIARVMPQPVS